MSSFDTALEINAARLLGKKTVKAYGMPSAMGKAAGARAEAAMSPVDHNGAASYHAAKGMALSDTNPEAASLHNDAAAIHKTAAAGNIKSEVAQRASKRAHEAEG